MLAAPSLSLGNAPVSRRTLLLPSALQIGRGTLTGAEAHHALRVLRLSVGDEVELADGAGHRAVARVVAVAKERMDLELTEVTAVADAPAGLLTVAVAAPKGDHLSDLVRGLTELGVGRIVPLICARGERVPAQLDRLERIAAEALKQCRRGHLPGIGPAVSVDELVRSGAVLMVADRAGRGSPLGRPRALTLVVGPEGGLTMDELAQLDAAGAQRVRLASSILRIETAAVALAAIFTAAWENLDP